MQILVPVTDLDRAVAFYEGVLELPLQMRFPGNAFFDAHGVRLYLASPTEPGFTGVATLYFRVGDVGATLDLLESRGARVIERPNIVFGTDDYDLWLAFVTDPDGNNIGLMREAPKGLTRG
jgi:predicted enzyme related to lactoylglutathione lyase